MTKLRPSSVENEYFQVIYGSMQYDKDINEMKIVSDDILKEEIDKTYDWKF